MDRAEDGAVTERLTPFKRDEEEVEAGDGEEGGFRGRGRGWVGGGVRRAMECLHV